MGATDEPFTDGNADAADSRGNATMVAAEVSGESPASEVSDENGSGAEPEGIAEHPDMVAEATVPASEPDSSRPSEPSETSEATEPSETSEATGTAGTEPVDPSPVPPDSETDHPSPSVVDVILAGTSNAPVSEPAPAPDTAVSSAADEPATVSETAPVASIPETAPVANLPETSPIIAEASPVQAPSALASAVAGPVAGMILNTDFESEDPACWNGNRAANGINAFGCGQFKSIGSAPYALTESGIAHSGSKAIAITYSKNEQSGGANVSFSSDSINMRAYYYFEPGFDFGQGVKIGRVSSFNTAKQINDIDIILEVRSAKSPSQCGVTDMNDVGVFFNGAPKGSDWGNVTSTMAFERGRWYAVEYQVVLNTPGRTDGAVRLWVDGKLASERTGLGIRGGLDAGVKLNSAKIGGWYSNSANGNSCADPSQPSKLRMDDVAIATSYIGTVPALTAGP